MAETQTEADPRLDDDEEEAAERWARETPDEAGLPREIDYERVKRFVIKRDGKDFIQYLGLVDLLHQESGGRFRIDTKLEQAPSEANGHTAIVSAEATILEDNPERGMLGSHLRVASGLGDANPGNVSRAMAPHTIRMAETRAKARALRDLLNVGMVALEELGADGPARDAPEPDRGSVAVNGRTGQVEGIVVEGKRWNRDQVWGFYQQRLSQAKERGLTLSTSLLINKDAPLSQIVGVTQNIKARLAPQQQPGDKAD